MSTMLPRVIAWRWLIPFLATQLHRQELPVFPCRSFCMPDIGWDRVLTMSIQDPTTPKDRNSVSHLTPGHCLTVMVMVFALGVTFCIFHLSSSFEVSAAQNSGGDPSH